MNSNRAVLALAVTAAVLTAGPAVAQAKTETDSSGPVSASFSYTANKNKTQFKNLKVVVSRSGTPVLTTTLPKYRGFWPGGAVDDSSVAVRDLDGDGEPEVIVKLYSGGINCCLSALFYSYRAATNTYVPVRGDFGRFGYRLRDLDRKGSIEIVGSDARFQNAFGLPTVISAVPIRILRLEKGKLTDATRGFKAEVRRDLRSLRGVDREFVRRKANRKGVLAAIVADQLTLNDRDGVVRTFQRIELLYGNEFSDRLKQFLARRGYKLKN